MESEWDLRLVLGEMTDTETLERHPALCRVRSTRRHRQANASTVRQIQRFGERNLTRRQFIISATAFAALLATGCGTGDDDDDAESSGRTVTHKFGETTVPANPSRVVSVGYDEHDLLLGFGVVPILQRDSWGDQPYATWPWSQSALGDAKPELFSDEELPYERILALKPDLIMATWAGIDQEMYDRLSQIAPTVAQHPDYEDWETPWDARALQVGAVFGKQAAAQESIDAIAERIRKIHDDHPEWHGLEAVTVTVGEGTFSVAMAGHSRGKLMADFGFSMPGEIASAAGEELFVEYSNEEMRIIDRDLIVWVNGYDDSSNVVNLPLRTNLTAHTEGREVYCDKILTAAFSIQSPLSYNFLLDKLVPEIEAAVDGDPATPVSLAVQFGLAP